MSTPSISLGPAPLRPSWTRILLLKRPVRKQIAQCGKEPPVQGALKGRHLSRNATERRGGEPGTEKESIRFFPWGLKQGEDMNLQDTMGPDLGEDIRV